MKMIPYGRQFIDDNDIIAVQKVMKNELITTGKEVKKFEKLFSKFIGSKHSVTCSSGTSGLLLAYLALGIKKNDVISFWQSPPSSGKCCASWNLIYKDNDGKSRILSMRKKEFPFPLTKRKLKILGTPSNVINRWLAK